MNEHFKDDMIFRTPQQEREEAEDVGHNTSGNTTMGDVIAIRLNRRDLLRGALAVTAISATVSPLALMAASKAHAAASAFSFEEIPVAIDKDHFVAPGYDAQVLLRWGDKVFADSPEFDPMSQTAAAQSRQFGYNNDFIGFIPLDAGGDRGLLCVNHEYTNGELMFPGWATVGKDEKGKDKVLMGEYTPELVGIEMMAHGGTIIEIARSDGKWAPVLDSKYNRRITADTEFEIKGPAAGHARLKTNADPSGSKVLGTLNNCAGGITPWGTYLMAEENFNGNFMGELPDGHMEAANYKRLGVPAGWYKWGMFHDRYDVAKEPNEPNRFGWIVEIDPTDPNSTPKKRTALGRFKHEGCESVVNKDGRVVIYSGDDERFDYVYKFVTKGIFNPADRSANMDLLDEGTLYVARFNPDGSLDWLPLVHGEGPLTLEGGFPDQASVLIDARLAGDALGATKMDRPEDIQPNPATGRAYLMLTNNTKREASQTDLANPRANNAFGHIIEIIEPEADFAATRSTWEILVKCGDPSIAEVGATFSAATTANGWFGMPDNCAIDADGRLWVSTDGNNAKATGRTDGLWAVDTAGEARGTSRLFYRVPVGAELCGPCFTPSSQSLFVAVQHPGDDGLATFENPATRWPDFKEGVPTRPSVVVIEKQGGGKIG